MLTQTLALLTDAYRELHAKKLFWITMVLSVFVVVAFSGFALTPTGMSYWIWDFENRINSSLFPPELFYKFLFTNFAIPIWLTWAATILALVSTASIIPDFLSGGAVELTLSKPISRVRLFLTKYCTGLLFVGLQVLAFSVGWFLLIGIRGKSWEPEIFLAVPIVLVFFSYLYCFCALFGLLTRSTIASLMLTIVVWLCLFGLNTTDGVFVTMRENTILKLEDKRDVVRRREEWAQKRLDEMKANGEELPVPDGVMSTDTLEAINPMIRTGRKDVAELEKTRESRVRWAGIISGVKTVFPKTQETVALLSRWMVSKEDMAMFQPGGGSNVRVNDREDAGEEAEDFEFGQHPKLGERIEAAKRNRTVGWVLGTSVAFEAALLVLCCWLFARRDF
ncbi:MAG: hypothetical protein RBS39_11640 [Phycisphaerales bacterium]|jgi:ABC-type transport system involved in multi-copper enzyme maturation permease subunit|nr:hypothetical protein [Phycisphaerales bacterium]